MLAAILTTETLWRNALAAIPVACAVALLCRWLPCRPSTRHLLWLVVLLVLLAPPGAPRLRLPWPAASQGAPSPAIEIATDAQPIAAPTAPAPVAEKTSTAPAVPSVPAVIAAAPPSISPPQSPAPSAARAASAPSTLTIPSNRASARESAPDSATQRPRPTTATSTYADRPPEVTPSRRTPTTATSTYADRPRETPAAAPTILATVPRPEPIRAVAPAAPATPPAPAAPAAALAGNPAPVWADPPPAPAAHTGWLRDARAGLDLWFSKAAALRDAVAALPALPLPIWAGGSVLILLVSGIRILRCRRLLRSGTPATEEVVRTVAAAAGTLGLRRIPRIDMVDARISPMVWCGRCPRLVLPTELWAELDPAGRAAVIHHELAHLRRRDHWVCWAQAAASLLYWWHPIVWWVGRRLRDEADLCCDAWVTTLFPMHRRAYAQALLDTRRFISDSRQAPPALGLGATTNRARHFARRLTMVMTQRPTPRRSLPGMFLAAGLCAAGVLSAPLLACPPEDEAQPSKAPSAQGGGGQGGVYGGVAAPSAPHAPHAPRAPKAPKPPKPAKAPRAAAVAVPHMAPPAPPVPPTPAAPGEWSTTVQEAPEAAQSTYEQHMAERHRAARPGAAPTPTPRGAVTTVRPSRPPAAVAMPAQPTMPAPPAMPARPAMPGQHGAFAPARQPGGDQNLEQRMDRLERRLDEMNQRMDRVLQRLERMSAAPGEPQFFATPDPVSPSLVATLAADPAGGPGSRAIVILLGDNNEIRAYSLGQEHLGALTALVDQSGSPLAVQQGGSAYYPKLADLAAIQGQVSGQIAKELALKQYAQAADLSALAERRAESDAAMAEFRSLSGRLKAGQAAQARALLESYRARAEAHSRSAEQLLERADAMAERADEMSETLEESRERAESLTGQAKAAAMDKAAALESAIEQLRRSAEQLRVEAEALAGRADQLSDEADQAADEQDDSDPEPVEEPSEDGR